MNVNTRRSAPGFAPIGEVRVIGGSLKRSKLAVLPRHGLRPTPDRVRETVFNWLAPTLEGARVLDLCAGTGVLGIEALSRGAKFAWLNEADPDLAAQILSAGQRLKIAHCMHVSRIAAERLLATLPDALFDIAFVDPPYKAGLWTKILDRLPTWLNPGALVYLEYPVELPAPYGSNWVVRKQSSAGRVSFCLLEHAPVSASLENQGENLTGR